LPGALQLLYRAANRPPDHDAVKIALLEQRVGALGGLEPKVGGSIDEIDANGTVRNGTKVGTAMRRTI